MGSQGSPRRTLRTTTLETLEDRIVMSADPLAGAIAEAQTLSTADLAEHGGLTADVPALAYQLGPDADFWIDANADRDLDAMLGDVEQTLASAHGTTGLTQARNAYGFIGTGQTVAIIDSGIAWDHVALGGGLGPNYRVVGGWDFSEENDANPYDDGGAGSHGTHVAGIVGASAKGLKDTGVAPGVDLVGLRVFNDSGAGSFAWVERALRWVHENRNSFENPITAVNMSLGTTWNANTIPNWTTLEDELAQLKADGIFTSVSAGNSFATYNTAGLSYPAASPSVVPVMSVDDNGQLSSFSQRHTRAIAAPGRYIMSTVPDYIGNHNNRADDYASFSGTSMAAPYVAGASVLVREAMQFAGMTNITQDTIFNHLLATADSVFDAVTGQTYKRLNLNSAISALLPNDDFGSTVATAHNLGTFAGTGTSTVSGILGRLDDADFFRFTASATGSVSLSTASDDGTSKWVTSTLGTFTQDSGTLSFNVVAGQTYAIGLAASAKVSHFQLAVHYTLASEAPRSLTPAEQASALDGQLGLALASSYSTNWGGMGEKWMRGADNRWYFITPDGAFYKWSGTRDLSGSTKLAQLDASFHADPRLLHEASSAPVTMPQLAQQLDQQLGLQSTGSYSFNWGGHNEKWMRGTNGAWFFIVPSGQLYRWNGQADLSTSTLIARFDGNYYTNPSLLHNATTPLAQTASVAQSQPAGKLSTAVAADSAVIVDAQRTNAQRPLSTPSTKHIVQREAATQTDRYTELAFESTTADRFSDESESLASASAINYHDEVENARAHALLEETHGAAVDKLFERIGRSVRSTEWPNQ